jgi:Na+:H+ antiporter, NhaA family
MLTPLREFLRLEAAGGLVLMMAAALALIVANSPLADSYATFLRLPFEIRLGTAGLAKPLLLWINDGLMAVFFFLVGMELKREVMEGHLSSWQGASLPAFAALGGMVAPAAVYVAFNSGDPNALKGWAIPAATDIAFALGVLSLLGDRVPPALKALLLSVAIFDDLGAILVIALFYTAELSSASLFVAAVVVAFLYALNRRGVTGTAAYILPGIVLWVAVLKSGVHATLAGVILAMFIPLGGETADGTSDSAPLRRLESALHPWVAFGILPIFAFANAGVPLGGLTLTDALHPVPLGIAMGLFAGKLVGVVSLSWLAVRLGVSSLPDQVGWRQLTGMALLCGIGFTMSLFIASLAFGQGDSDYQGLERLGILSGTLVSGLAGYAVLRMATLRNGETNADG